MTTYTKKYNCFLHLFLFLMLTLTTWEVTAQETTDPLPFVRESIVKNITSNHEYQEYVAANLMEIGYRKRYYSGNPADENWTEPAYLEVELKDDGLSYDDPNHLLIYVRRVEAGFENAHPTAFRVEGLFGDDDPKNPKNWHELFYVYLLYRGNYTQEYSSKVSIKKLWTDVLENPNEYDPDKLSPIYDTKKKLTRLRFYVTANNNREYDPTTKYRDMAISRFDVIKIDPSADYSDTFVDRFHTPGDYVRSLQDYEFKNTRGIIDDPNKVNGWDIPTAADQAALKAAGIEIELPDFSFIDNAKSDYTLDEEDPKQLRQATHSVEHIIYALPGDVVALYPYYQMWDTGYYEENFSHWYNYRTGGRLTYNAPWSHRDYELLDFAIDPTNILISDKYGFYGSQQLNGRNFSVGTVEEYIAAVNYINTYDHGAYIELTADLDFGGRTDIPMIGDSYAHSFTGFFNGNGHRISNLKYKTDENNYGVGLIGRTANNAHIENLIVDSSCEFVGRENVGLVGRHFDGYLYIRNVRTEATVYAESATYRVDNGERLVGGIVGHNDGNTCRLRIENCYIGGRIGRPEDEGKGRNNGAISGWLGVDNINKDADGNPVDGPRFTNVIVNAEIYGCEGENYYFRGQDASKFVITECYGVKGEKQGFQAYNAGDPFPFQWADQTPPVGEVGDDVRNRLNGDRVAGTYATFFCPRNPYSAAGVQHSLPFEDMKGLTNVYKDENGDLKDEFVIAADFSQEFVKDKHISDNDKTITEPIISMRHLFRIRDGKEFAENFSGSAEKNENFVRKNQKMVSARAGFPFQIRFDTPVPEKGTTRSNYYYKISDDDYRRVCSMDIRVLDAQTRAEISNEEIGFKFGEAFKGQGSRMIDGVSYELCGGGTDQYFRMLECDSPEEGNYIVQLIGKDVNGNLIKVYGSDDRDLVVMEYNITFLPAAGASMLTEDQLYGADNKFSHAREEVMEERYGRPNTFIDFDEYSKLEKLQGTALKNKLLDSNAENKSYYKWPLPWKSCNYSFGYDDAHDYNMYRIANHSTRTRFNVAANKYDGNAEGDGKGLYDRRYYDTMRLNQEDSSQDIEKGYFYYVNAATDPGVSARLNVQNLCMGSTIYVSAWVAEFSENPETANLSFNFVAVLNGDKQLEDGTWEEGERVVLHSFISGYIPREGASSADAAGTKKDYRGKWMNIYYSFVPRLTEFSAEGISSDMVHHYELELDNNCKSSDGADYAIDDIRVYVVRPVIYASQMKPVCDIKSARIKVESPFNTLLQTLGEKEQTGDGAGVDIEMYYTFLDKDIFDNTYDKTIGNGQEAFEAAVVKFAYDDRGTDEESSTYGKVGFNTNYSKNQEYSEDPAEKDKAMREIGEDGERMIVFFSDLIDEKFYVGKEYYVVLKTPLESEGSAISTDRGSEWTFFDMEGECAKRSVFSIIPSNTVKVDGVVVPDLAAMSVCESQSPVIQINLQGENEETGEYELVERNAWFDWFNGSMEEFESYRNDNDDEESHDLETALKTFRTYYPEAAEIEGIKAEGSLEQWMIDLLEKAVIPAEGDTEGKLLLRQTSYVFPPLRFKEGEKETAYRVVAIPIPVDNDDNLVVCTAPAELRIRVEGRAPELAHGLSSITYPEDMNDVPLRIGLDQIRAYNNGAKEMKTVEIPVRHVAATGFSQNIDKMTLKDNAQSTMIILVQTNDPEYKDLGTVDANGEETGVLLETGEVNALNAEIEGGENLFRAVFDEDFNFKEGYYYRFRFNYEEGTNETTEEDKKVCDGQDVFTLKIVPRYLQWTGEQGLNWNNDANWRRIVGEEMRNEEENGKIDYLADAQSGGKEVNGNLNAYAPLDFTSVIIPYGIEAPWLYAPSMEKKDGFDWAASPSVIPDGATYADRPEKVGDATENIQYDMAAYYKKENGDGEEVADWDKMVYCRPWYANTCYDIHFNAGSAIMNQHELNYTRAWADVELDPTRWYLLSTPFQEVYAGDFYLPSANARQETEYFKEITYDEKINNRFHPAVYQRGWDKGSATVYEIGKEEGRNVALRTSWSRVYNDVKEQYGNGVGFSIKTDVSALGDDFEENDKVMFRLPKDDKEYLYYDLEGTNSGHLTAITRTQGAHYRLNGFDENGESSVTISGASEGKIFLAGNPMMSRLDIAEFMKANEDVIKPHLWIITEKGQEVVLADENNNSVMESVTTLAPFQGFFVEAVKPADSITLKYNTSMMRRHQYDEDGEVTEGLTRAGSAPLRIAAFVDGNRHSSAVISPEGVGTGVMALDNRELGIESIVYSVNGESAMSVDFAPLEGREIGVIADGDTETVLRFENTAIAEDLYLYDKAEGSLTPIEEGMEYEVKGAVAGRLFITAGREEIAVPSAISWKEEGGLVEVTDCSAGGWLSVNVYDTLGRCVKNVSTSDSSVNFTLGTGVYVMEIQTAAENKKVKFVI